MALVYINNRVKKAITLIAGLGATTATSGFITLVSTVPQNYHVKTNGGSPVLFTGSTTTNVISFPCTGDTSVTLEIEVIDGGTFDNVTEFKVSTNSTYMTSTALNILQNFPNLEVLHTCLQNITNANLSGVISNLPTSLIDFRYKGTISGTVSQLPAALEILKILGQDINISGSFVDFPNTIEEIQISTIYTAPIGGNIGDLPSVFRILNLDPGNAVTCDFDNLPSSVEFINFGNSPVGDITFTGSIDNCPANLNYFSISGSSAGSSCDISGNITNLPSTMTYFELDDVTSDTNTITGDIANLPASLTGITLKGTNTLSGDISTVPSNLVRFIIYGNNTISGTIQSFNGISGIFMIEGNNTISGDLGLISAAFNILNVIGNNTISSFTFPALSQIVKDGATFNIIIQGDSSLSSANIDDLLSHFDAFLPITTGNKPLEFTGTATGPRTAASDIPYNSLISKGYIITLN